MAADDVSPKFDRYASILKRFHVRFQNIDTVPTQIRYALLEYYDWMEAATLKYNKQTFAQY